MNNTFHVIKDPVHGTMQFTTMENNWIKPFINNPLFQRLRHIKQMGMGDYIFPGATHTRFNHSLGCSYVASQISQKIGLEPLERQLVLIACLLHDIGHGPFSHTFEDVFRNKEIRHEAWTPFFLRDFKNEDFFREYNKWNKKFPLDEEKFNTIADMIMHKSPHSVLADIVSSQLDADRLDYLLRDSHFCGVTYGQFDFRWMLNSLTIVQSGQKNHLAVTHKGIGVTEHYLMARRLMIRNIYQFSKKLALEFFLIQFLRTVSKNLDYSLFSELKETRLGKFLNAVNYFNENSQDKNIFLQENYSNYKELCDYDVFLMIKNLCATQSNHAAVKLAERLQDRNIPRILALNPEQIKKTENMLHELQSKNLYQDWQIAIIKSPHQSYSNEEPILVLTEKGLVQPINEISLIIQAVSDKFENSAFLAIDNEIYNDAAVQKFLKSFAEADLEVF